MPFQKIEPEKVANSITRQIEALILRGVLRPGERLPSERDLATRMGVSRPSLREALGDLEERGLVETKPGSGAFIAQFLGSAFAPSLVRLFSEHDEALFDYISFRRDLEGMAAARAATYASDTDIRVISSIFTRMEQMHSKKSSEKETKLDADFHMAIVEASHNVIMMHMMRSMFDMLKAGVFYNRNLMYEKRTIRGVLLDHHRAILNAIVARDPDAARKAAEDHLTFIETAMKQHVKDRQNEETSSLRLMHEMGQI